MHLYGVFFLGVGGVTPFLHPFFFLHSFFTPLEKLILPVQKCCVQAF